jgi:subtilase family serine protease
MSCRSLVRTDITSRFTPSGYGPSNLQAAYGLTSASSTQGVAQTVAIVDAFDDPNAETDLAVYRAQFGLGPCTTANGCFLKVNQNGVAGNYPGTDPGPPFAGGWEEEESLDLDMVSAVCPHCDILLVEANSPSGSDLYAAVDTAASSCAAQVVSNSWGGGEYSTEGSDEFNFNHPGVPITFASGDTGTGSSYPPTSAFVTSVGGTTLTKSGSTYSETVWSGTGSGCSQFISQPAWQNSLDTIGCGMRMDNDVAAVADPSTGVAVYDTFSPINGWAVFGGTSAATPIIASVYALAGNGTSINDGRFSYSHTGFFNDVTSGTNGGCGTIICMAGPGWDGPTGNGTPNGTGGF